MCPASLLSSKGTGMTRIRALVPAYFYPSDGSAWGALAADPAGVGVAVANVNSGPGVGVNDDYVSAVSAAQAAGVPVYGYVDCNYTARPLSDVYAEVFAWRQAYNVDGVFLDRAPTGAGDVAYCQSVRSYIDGAMQPGKRNLVLNHGTNPAEVYAEIGDVLITFEGAGSEYNAYAPAGWMQGYPAEKFCHLVYDETDYETKFTLALERNVGWFYCTDDTLPNPWDTLPTQWGSLRGLLAATKGNVFRPPTVQQGFITSDYFWKKFTGTVGLTVLITGGTAELKQYPSQTDVAAADYVFHGGHVYEVSAAEAAAIEAAGLGGYLE